MPDRLAGRASRAGTRKSREQRIVRTAFAAGVIDDPPLGRVVDPFKGADSAQRIAEQSSVLLKNANALLPFYWDTGGLLGRSSNAVLDQQALDALIDGSRR